MNKLYIICLIFLCSCVEKITPIKKEIYETNPTEVHIGYNEDINDVVEITPIPHDEVIVEVPQNEEEKVVEKNEEESDKQEEVVPVLVIIPEVKEEKDEQVITVIPTFESEPEIKEEETLEEQATIPDVVEIIPVIENKSPLIVEPTKEVKEEAKPIEIQEEVVAIQPELVEEVKVETVPEVSDVVVVPKVEEIKEKEVVREVVHEEENLVIQETNENIIKSILPDIFNPNLSGEVKSIAQEFLYYANLANTPTDMEKLSVIFDESLVSRPYVAYCQKIKNNTVPQVVVNKSFWTRFNYEYKHQLLFHEMGHCLLGRPHLGASFDKPVSVMNEFIIGSSTYLTKYDYFVKELFNIKDANKQFIFGSLK